MTADVLSDVLRAIRLTGAVYFDFELSSPWVAEAPHSSELAPVVMPGAQRVIEYHLIASGSCWGHAVDAEPIRLNEGDLIIFPQGDPHVMASAPGMRATPDMSLFPRSPKPLPLIYEMGGGGPDRTRVVCGFLGCDDKPFNPLLEALPPVIHMEASGHRATTGYLGTLLTMALKESGSARAGGENILARLAELMFVEAIRWHLEALPPAQTGWLAGRGARPDGGAGARGHAPRPARGLDRGEPGAPRRRFALGVRRAILRDGGIAANAVSGDVADAARLAATARRRSRRRSRRGGGVRV